MKVKGRALSYVPVSGATMKNELVATVTEGGAVLLPEEILTRLDLTVGAKLLLEVVTGGEALILRRKKGHQPTLYRLKARQKTSLLPPSKLDQKNWMSSLAP